MYRRILVPVDGSVPALKGLNEAIKLVKATGAKLKLLHVVNEAFFDASYIPSAYYDEAVQAFREAGARVLDAAVAAARDQNVEVERQLAETIGGRAADVIVDAAKEWPADLIVMGTHGRRGLSRLALGSDAEMVLRQSPVPVLIMREKPEAR
jgi:nucleotide-binding universal stress UspA family protein